jgi:Citrate lyase beta subunit
MSYLLRSMLFVPGYNEKFLTKAIDCDADALILDIEDSVPAVNRPQARELIRKFLTERVFKNRQIFIRVNELGTDDLSEDLKLMECPDIMGVVTPKIYTAEDLLSFEKMILEKERECGKPEGEIKLAPLIETAGAVMNLTEIARVSKRTIALLYGGEDFLSDVWGKHIPDVDSFFVARGQVVMAARMNGLLPIDTPFLDLKNEEGYKHDQRKSAALGFAGDLLVTPQQIEWAHEIYTPTNGELERSKAILAVAEEIRKQGGGIVKLNGKMIGPPVMKQAQRVMEIFKLIEEKNLREGRKDKSN